MDALRKKLSNNDFVLLAINASNNAEGTKEYLKEIQSDYAMLMDEQGEVRTKYQIPGTPVTVIINKEGRAIFNHLGYGEGDEVQYEKEVQMLIDNK